MFSSGRNIIPPRLVGQNAIPPPTIIPHPETVYKKCWLRSCVTILCIRIKHYLKLVMVSAVDRAKRTLVSHLKSLAVVYRVLLSVARDSSDQAALGESLAPVF